MNSNTGKIYIWSKITGALLAAVLLTGLAAPAVFEGSVQAAGDGTSALSKNPQVITSLKDIGFDENSGTNVIGTSYGVSGNLMTLSCEAGMGYYTSGSGVNKGWGSQTTAINNIPVSLRHSWTVKVKMRMADIAAGGYSGVGLANDLGIGVSRGTVSESWGLYWKKSQYYLGFVRDASKGIKVTQDEIGKPQEVTLTYNARSREFAIKLKEYSKTFASSFTTSEEWANLYVFCDIGTHVDSKPDDFLITLEWEAFQYTDYAPQITSTKFYSQNGKELKGNIGKNQIVIVETTIKNTKDDDLPSVFSVSDKAGFTGITPLPAGSQDVVVNGTAIPNGNINAGIDCTVPGAGSAASELKIRYKAKVTGSAGSRISVPHMITDKYFSNPALPQGWQDVASQYAVLDRTVSRDIISDLDKKPTYDYSHDIKPNDRGWYNGNLTLDFHESDDFSHFFIDGVKANSKTFIEETGPAGQDVNVYASKENTDGTIREISNLRTENLKIDKTAPTVSIADRKQRLITLTDPDTNSVPPDNPQRDDIHCSGIASLQMKGPDDKDYKTVKNFLSSTDQHGKPEESFTYPAFTKTGTWAFRAADAAGNYGPAVTVAAQLPEIKAESLSLPYADQASYIPAASHKAEFVDDEVIPVTSLRWSIKAAGEEFPVDFTSISGAGNDGLPGGLILPIGTYTVTFTMDGSDQDGITAKEKKVTLKITGNNPPSIIDEGGNTVMPDGDIVIDPSTGTAHAKAKDECIVVADPSAPYKGGLLNTDEAKAEVEDRFQFEPDLENDTLSTSVTITQNGIEVGAINTSRQGTYIIVYKVTDSTGCSATMELTFKVVTDYYITFHSDRGEFTNGKMEKKTSIKAGNKLTASKIPRADELKAPANYKFIGWSLSPHDSSASDPLKDAVNGDITYYAVYEPVVPESVPSYDENITVTFFSADARTGKLSGSDGVQVKLKAEKGKSITLNASQLPGIAYRNGGSLKGWKTDDTGDKLLSTNAMLSLRLSGGDKRTCIAYIDSPPVSKPETKTVTKNKVIHSTSPVKTVVSEDNRCATVFSFYSSNSKYAALKGGDGTQLKLNGTRGEAVSLSGRELPELEIKNSGLRNIFWKTNLTGERLMTEKELLNLKAAAGSTVNCTAYFEVEEPEVSRQSQSVGSAKDAQISGNITQFIDNGKVPLGAAPDFSNIGKSCSIHWYMVIWIFLCAVYEIWSIHKRRKSFDYEHTTISDWIYMAAALLLGCILTLFGKCPLELWTLAALALVLICYLICMKWLDHKNAVRRRELVINTRDEIFDGTEE